MNDVERRAELAHFLRTRREHLSPTLFQLPEGAKRRRTPGLRREELAQVAGISPTWYTKLEQGQEIQVSAQILESLAHALQLTSDERTHLYVLAREQLPLPAHTHPTRICQELQGTLDALNPYPVLVMNKRWDIVGWNRSASLVFIEYSTLSAWERNFVWIIFTQSTQRTLFVRWEYWARQTLALFRASGGRSAGELWFTERRDRLMGESPEFRTWWDMHEVSEARMGQKELHHPHVGLLFLQATPLLVADNSDLTMFLYTPLPQEDTAQKLLWLFSFAQTGAQVSLAE